MTNASASIGRYREDYHKDLLSHEYDALETDVEDTMSRSRRDEEEPGNPVSLSPSSPTAMDDGLPWSASNDGNFLGIYTYPRLKSAVARCLLGVFSIFLGLLTLFPNMMMSDSGTAAARMAAFIGMVASFLFLFAGIAMFVRGTWIWMLVAVTCQALAFAVPAFLAKNR